MPQRLETAFVFGHLGNLTEALGHGWSVEDHYAWAVGEESHLSLPLPGDAADYRLRFTLHPLVRQGIRNAQRLALATAEGELADFEVSKPTTLEIPLPSVLTRGRSRLDLILTHPDALRPRDFMDSPDSRWLTLCFQSAGLLRDEAEAADRSAAAAEGEVCHGLVIGHEPARQMAAILNRLPCLQGKAVLHHISPDGSLDAALAGVPPPALDAARLCWQQEGVGTAAIRAALDRSMPKDCVRQTFPSLRLNALWPFLGDDPRLVAEPGRHDAGRYPYGDRIAASLAGMWLPDDVVALSYESMLEKELADLDARLAADADLWRASDAATDVAVTDYILQHFRQQRWLFVAPTRIGPSLLRHMLEQLFAGSPLATLCDAATLRRELDALMAGYIGRREELPVPPAVARHFRLEWWRPGMTYRWAGNRWTFEQYALNAIRWHAWRP